MRLSARRYLGVVTALVVLTACGSTVQQKGLLPSQAGAVGSSDALGGSLAQTQGGVGGDASSTGASAGVAGKGAAVAGQGGSAGSSAAGAVGDQSVVRGGGGSTGASVAPGPIPAKGFGWDAAKVYIGYPNISDNSTASVLGYDQGNLPAVIGALVKDINAHGGLFGRSLVALEFDQHYADVSANPAQAAERACTYFTQDHPVIGVLNIIPTFDNVDGFHTCLAKKRVAELSGSVFQSVDSTFRALSPYFYSLIGASWDRLGGPMMNTLKANGYFTGWDTGTGKPSKTTPVKTGIIYLDTVTGRAIRDAQVRALKQIGYAPTATYGAGEGTTAATANSFILDMRNRGITHLLSYSVGVAAKVASSQNFHPRWGVSSYNTPQSLPRTAGADQLNGSMGVGWAPTLDVSQADERKAPTPGAARCTSILTGSGQTFDDSKRFAQAVAYIFCDSVTLLVAGAKKGGGLDAAALAKGIAALGPAFSPATTFASALRPGHEDTPAVLRPLAFDNGCGCYHYISGPQRFTR